MSHAAAASAPTPRTPRLGFTRVPKKWFAGSAGATQVANGVNLLFPAGERFFVGACDTTLAELGRSCARRAGAGLLRTGGPSCAGARALLRDDARAGLRRRRDPRAVRGARLREDREGRVARAAPCGDRCSRALHGDPRGGCARGRHARPRPPGDAAAPRMARRRGARAQGGGVRCPPRRQPELRAPAWRASRWRPSCSAASGSRRRARCSVRTA